MAGVADIGSEVAAANGDGGGGDGVRIHGDSDGVRYTTDLGGDDGVA